MASETGSSVVEDGLFRYFRLKGLESLFDKSPTQGFLFFWRFGGVPEGMWDGDRRNDAVGSDRLRDGDDGAHMDHGEAGTLGELSPKPHPWLYADVCRVGLGIPGEQRHHVVGIEDSGAGVCSVRLAGYTAIGMAGGNIIESGTRALCTHYCSSFPEILSIIMQRQAAT